MIPVRVVVLTVGDPGQMTGGYLYHRRMAAAAARHGAQVAFVSIPAWPIAWALPVGLWRLRSPALRAADVVVLDSIAAAAAAPWLGTLHRPIVGMLHQAPGGMDAAALTRRVRALLDRRAYRPCDLLMVASDWLAEQLAGDGVDPSRIVVVPPGKDPAASAGSEAEAVGADPAPLPGEGRTVLRSGREIAALCVANWLPRKGIVELLEAVAMLPEDLVTLHLVGDTLPGRAYARYARRIRARLEQPDLRDRVVVHGVVPPASVHRIYRSADLFVLPSFEEPYGTAWGEAMAAGLPIVGWRAGNLPYLADHEREGLLASTGDVAALAANIERIARDHDMRERMGRAAELRARSFPTWDETAARFFGIIGDVQARFERRRGGLDPH